MICDHILGAIALASDLSATDRLVLFAIGGDCLSLEEILDRVRPFDATEQLRSLLERSIVALAEPDLLTVRDPTTWADRPALNAIERIAEARQRAADPDGWDGPVLLKFSRGMSRRSPATGARRSRKRREGVERDDAATTARRTR
jgi:hypothetical protein